jgi:hypothetical protein
VGLLHAKGSMALSCFRLCCAWQVEVQSVYLECVECLLAGFGYCAAALLASALLVLVF